MSNPKRKFHVPAEWTQNILDACRSQSWRVYFAFLRIGALRKMEPQLLKWEDILWDRDRFHIYCEKTQEFEGKTDSFCPLFPELERELSALYELQGYLAGGKYVLDDDVRTRSENAIYNAVERTVIRAGYSPWERLLQNLRSTRESELLRVFPEHQVALG